MLLGFAVLFGCAKHKNMMVGDLPPETVISVHAVAPDTLASVNHRVRLFWFGSDPDGEVVAYDIRFFNGATPADTNWHRLVCASGDCTDSLFTIYSPTGYTSAFFEVRAVDNQGVVDPSPAIERFSFLNSAPIAKFISAPTPSDSTYASATVTWSVDDVGGDVAKIGFHVYLDGAAANFDSIYSGNPTTTYTIPSSKFLQSGQWRSGYRTLYVQAIDDGGRIGPVDSTRWYVRSPGLVNMTGNGRALLVDDSRSTSTNNLTVDTMYVNALTRNLPPGSFSVLRLQFNSGAIRSAQDLAQTFRQFDAVIWYRGWDATADPTLTTYQDSIAAYFTHGGRFFIEAMNLIDGPNLEQFQTPPLAARPWTEDYAIQHFGIVRVRRYLNDTFHDSTTAWSPAQGAAAQMRSSALRDSFTLLSVPLVIPGLRTFEPVDTNNVLIWAKPNGLNPATPEQQPIALTVRQPGGGRAMLYTFPVRVCQPFSRILAKSLFDPVYGLYAP
jgi:hypothetical protein